MFSIKSTGSKETAFFSETIFTWAPANFASYPWRFTKNRWHALVAEIMLQRTSAEQVLPVYNSFCASYKTPRDYFLNPNGTLFDSLGLKWRTAKLFELAAILAENNIPDDKNELLQLPGVGEYIASAYRSLHLGLYDVIIDSNIVRLYGRYFGFTTDGETRRKKQLKELANRLTPQRHFQTYNYGMIDFTRTLCRPVPDCGKCPLAFNKKVSAGCCHNRW